MRLFCCILKLFDHFHVQFVLHDEKDLRTAILVVFERALKSPPEWTWNDRKDGAYSHIARVLCCHRGTVIAVLDKYCASGVEGDATARKLYVTERKQGSGRQPKILLGTEQGDVTFG